MPIIYECFNFLKQNAIGKWFETYRIKDKDTDAYLNPIHRGMVLLRVETDTKRAFYWIYNLQDSIAFNEFVGFQMKAEAHELILSPQCRLFYDIDLALDEFQKHEFAEHYEVDLSDGKENLSMDEIGKQLAIVFKDATLISLEEHGIDIETDLVGFDYMHTMRNRRLNDDGFKISIHLITNLILPLNACSAIVSHIKSEVMQHNIEVLGINEDMVDTLIESIDETQYRRHGSLGLPYGTKSSSFGKITNWIYRDYSIPNQNYFITIEDQFSIRDIDLTEYNIDEPSNYSGVEANPDFVQEALKHVKNIKDYNPRVWDLNASVLKRSTMYVKRYAPSMCSICKRTHDSDNTLFLIFNSEKGVASWKCARMPEMKPIIFYHTDDTNANNDVDAVEAFASKYSKCKPIIKKCATQTISNPVPVQISNYTNDVDIEVFRTKHSKKKTIATNNDLADPFEKAPFKKQKSFIRRNPLPKKISEDHSNYNLGIEYEDDERKSNKNPKLVKTAQPSDKYKYKKIIHNTQNEYSSDEETISKICKMTIGIRSKTKSKIKSFTLNDEY